MRRIIWALIAFAFAACSGGGGGASPSDTISPKARDQLAVDAAALQPADLPPTYSPDKATDVLSSTRDRVSEAADECLKTDADATAIAIRELLSGKELGHIIVRAEVEAHADAGALTTAMAGLKQDDIAACVKDFASKLFNSPDSTIGTVAVTPKGVDGVGEDVGGFVLSVPVAIGGLQFTIGNDIAFARVGRYRATVSVITFDRDPDHSLAVAAMTGMVKRLPSS